MEYEEFEKEILSDEKIREKVDRLKEHDLVTYEHSLRIMKSCYKLGRHFNFAYDELNQLLIGGLLHDIGKIWVPKEILSKKELNIEDVNVIRKHPLNGFNYVRDLESKYPLVPGIVGKHHSFSDNPYPIKSDTAYGKINTNQFGGNMEFMLFGEDLAKVVSVAEVFDALINKRPYKRAWNFEDSINELRRTFGKDEFILKCISYIEKNYNKEMS